jgi:outer membrane receptor protein involved in Fe transport
MIKKITILMFVFSVFTNFCFSQQKHIEKSSGSISGKVLDETTKKPVEFANIILFDQQDNSQIGGIVTNKDGNFSLTGIKIGKYYFQVQFVGYERKKIENISITNSNLHYNAGTIFLKPTTINLQNVVVEGQRSPISYELDKKVVDVSQIQTAITGSAADVLANVPSVNVDIDGTVSLRGSTNFTVYIDGRPSIMSSQDALQQIPASAIQNIEIITNPSAKYDASGDAGIINIILKKNSNLGLSGIVDLSGGVSNKYGGNFLFQYKTPLISYDFGAYLNHRFFPGSSKQNKEFIINNSTSFLNSDGNMTWGRIMSGLRGGIDFNFSENDNLSFSGRYGDRTFQRNSTAFYTQWSTQSPVINYLNNTNRNHSGTSYDLDMNFVHKFNLEGHQLNGDFSFGHSNSDEAALSTAVQNNFMLNGTKTTEIGPFSRYRGTIDYTLPFNKFEKFSAGSEFQSRVYQDINKFYLYDSTSGNYVFQPLYSNTNDFNRTRFAAYSIYSNQWDSLGVQIGFRAEYTFQSVKLAETNQQFSLNRWDYFPSLHSSFNLANGTQLMASYSRRIDRPDGGDLEPFYTWLDANDVRIGNPNLLPEYIDSYDLGYQTFFGSVSFSNDFYYRFTHNKRQDITSVYEENVTLRSPANVGTDYSLGAEFMILFNPIKLWQLNLMGDVYDYRIKGSINELSFARESFNWSIKNNNVFKITNSTELQLNTRYFSPSVSAQGKWEGFFTTDMAVKQSFLNKNLSFTLQIQDLFHTGKREFISQGIDFYNYQYFTRNAPVVMLNVRLNFNNYKDKKNDSNIQDNSVQSEE